MSGMDCQSSINSVIDYEVSLFDRAEIAGAYRSICAMLLLRTATIVRKPTRFRNTEQQQKRTAKLWVERESEGVITFREACAAIDADPKQMKRDILALVCSEPIKPINQTKPAYVFGRKDESCCETANVS